MRGKGRKRLDERDERRGGLVLCEGKAQSGTRISFGKSKGEEDEKREPRCSMRIYLAKEEENANEMRPNRQTTVRTKARRQRVSWIWNPESR